MEIWWLQTTWFPALLDSPQFFAIHCKIPSWDGLLLYVHTTTGSQFSVGSSSIRSYNKGQNYSMITAWELSTLEFIRCTEDDQRELDRRQTKDVFLWEGRAGFFTMVLEIRKLVVMNQAFDIIVVSNCKVWAEPPLAFMRNQVWVDRVFSDRVFLERDFWLWTSHSSLGLTRPGLKTLGNLGELICVPMVFRREGKGRFLMRLGLIFNGFFYKYCRALRVLTRNSFENRNDYCHVYQ